MCSQLSSEDNIADTINAYDKLCERAYDVYTISQQIKREFIYYANCTGVEDGEDVYNLYMQDWDTGVSVDVVSIPKSWLTDTSGAWQETLKEEIRAEKMLLESETDAREFAEYKRLAAKYGKQL